MKIRYFGHSYFLIEGEEYSIALDPFSNVGLKEVEVKSDYVFCSHEHFDHNNKSLTVGAKEITKSDGVFEIVSTFHDEKQGTLRGKNNVLIFYLDGFKLAFLGDLGEYGNKNLIEKLNGVDVLFIPVGGKYTIDSEGAYEYAIKSQAKTVIPMHYKAGASTIDIKGVQPFLDKFVSYKTVASPYAYGREKGVVLVKFEGECL